MGCLTDFGGQGQLFNDMLKIKHFFLVYCQESFQISFRSCRCCRPTLSFQKSVEYASVICLSLSTMLQNHEPSHGDLPPQNTRLHWQVHPIQLHV